MTAPIRLFMTVDAVGGVWQYALDLARGLAAHGVETTLAVLGPDPDADQEEAATAVPGLKFLSTGLPLDWLAETPEAVQEASVSTARFANVINADIVHLNSPALAAAGRFRAPVVAVCHSCVATWWQAVRGGPMPAELQWRADFVRRGCRRADALVAPTVDFAEATARTYRLPKPPVVVRNGRRRVPAVGAPPQAGDFAFAAGRLWDEGKNFEVLNRAAARLTIPVMAAGPLRGPNGTQAEFGYLWTLGRLDDMAMARWLEAAPVFVSAARYEPFGLAVLEAAQAGCALILADIPTYRELWGEAAEFVRPDDDAAIAAAIEAMLREPERRARLGDAARRAAAAYTVEAMTGGVFDIYRSLLRNRGGPRKGLEAA